MENDEEMLYGQLLNMEQFILFTGVALVTTMDDTIYLSSFYLEGTDRYKVVIGEILGFTTLVLVSLLISSSLPHLHLLGLIPIFIGISKLKEADGEEGVNTGNGSIMSVYLMNVCNGGNNLAVFIPLFNRVDPAPVILTCYLFILIWLQMSEYIASVRFIKRYLYKLSPILYIGIGLKILFI